MEQMAVSFLTKVAQISKIRQKRNKKACKQISCPLAGVSSFNLTMNGILSFFKLFTLLFRVQEKVFPIATLVVP